MTIFEKKKKKFSLFQDCLKSPKHCPKIRVFWGGGGGGGNPFNPLIFTFLLEYGSTNGVYFSGETTCLGKILGISEVMPNIESASSQKWSEL